MRRSASEKMELIDLVERTDLPVRVTLRQLGIPSSTFYGWYKRYVDGGFDALQDKTPPPRPRWNQVPEKVRAEVIDLALKKTELSARELACNFTDERQYFLSESSVYRILKAADLITSPAYVLMSASDRFKHPTQRVNEMWQTDFTYLRVIGWGWYYLSTVMDDFSRFILAYKLGPTMASTDVTETLDEALALTRVHSVRVRHRPRLLSDNGPAYVSKDLQEYLRGAGHDAHPRSPVPSADAGEDRALPPLHEERREATALRLPVGARCRGARFRRLLQPSPLPRVARQLYAGGRVLRPAP